MANVRTALNCGALDLPTRPIDFAEVEITLDKTIHESLVPHKFSPSRKSPISLRKNT